MGAPLEPKTMDAATGAAHPHATGMELRQPQRALVADDALCFGDDAK